MSSLVIRRAVEADLPVVVRLFATPDHGNPKHEDLGPPLPSCYTEALAKIADDPNNALMVAELEGSVLGAFHLTVIQYVANRGGRVAQVENVIVAPAFRSRGIGEAMMRWAIDEARARVLPYPAYQQQGAEARAPFLRAARVRGQPRGHEAPVRAVTARS
jgi:ribosomal protein S18 acetylase RimI-like enzyme